MRKGSNLYKNMLRGKCLKDAITEHQIFKVDVNGSGFDKTLQLATERNELLILASAMADFIIINGIEGSFRSFIFTDE